MTQREDLEPTQGRLQREPGADGFRLDSFRDILKRHGLLMLSLAILCLFLPNAFDALAWSTSRFVSNPMPYFLAATALFIFFLAYSHFSLEELNFRQLVWVFYLLGISIVEEWIFRLVIPAFLEDYLPFLYGVIISNFIFAALHYISLRWRLRMCIRTFFGAMFLSYLMLRGGDLILLIGIHWFGTFMNTPKPPTKN